MPARDSWVARLAPLLAFAILTAIAARPVLTQLDAVIIGSDQDVFINPWADMWTLRALTEPGTSLWFTRLLFYPEGADLHYHSFSHLTSAMSLALRPLLGALPAYNVTILLHLVLAGVAMFHFARYLTGSALAGFLAGLVFAFNWHNLWQISNPVTVSNWPLPWMGLFLLKALDRKDARYALVAALFVLLAALGSTLMLILAALWLGFVLFYALATGRLGRSALPVLGVFAAASMILALVPLLPLIGETLLRGSTSFIVGGGLPLPTDALAPLQPLWSGELGRSVHFGVAPLLLLAVALTRLRRSWPWFLLLFISYLFAIGPHPVVGDVPVDVTLPWSHAIRPLLRYPYRLNVLTALGLAVAVAYGWTALVARSGWKRGPQWMVALLLAGLIFAEYTHPPFPRRTLTVSAFYTEFLDGVPDDVALAILPTGRQEDKPYMYYQTLHGHPITGGVISRPADGTFDFIAGNALLRAGSVNWEPVPLPGDVAPALAELAAAGVGYLVLDKPLFAQTELELELWRERIAVAPVYEDDLVVVFATRPD
jgi:hypothetical protein